MRNSNAVTKLLAMALCAISLAACATPSQVYWDGKVKELCEKDGGVTVYEKVEVLKKDYPNIINGHGVLMIPSDGHVKSSDPFFLTFKTISLKEGSPEVFRFEQTIVRASDKKELSKLISYGRRGGDILPIDNQSSFSCGDSVKNIHDFQSVITVKGE